MDPPTNTILPRKSQSQKKKCGDKANHRPFDCPLNPRTPREFLSPPRAPQRRIMTSNTGNNKKTPIVLISTANPASLSSYKGTDSAIASPIAQFLLRAAAGPGTGCSRDQRPSSSDYSTLAAPLPHMKHCAHLWGSIDNTLKRERWQRLRRDLRHRPGEL